MASWGQAVSRVKRLVREWTPGARDGRDMSMYDTHSSVSVLQGEKGELGIKVRITGEPGAKPWLPGP